MKDTYLSIDLDYWNYSRPQRAEQFFHKVLDWSLPVRVVESHEQLLPDIRTVPKHVRTLVNIDFHDDFDTPVKRADVLCNGLLAVADNLCHEGAWVPRVSWRREGTYLWRYPSRVFCVEETRGVCGLTPWGSDMTCYWASGWDTINAKQGTYIDMSRVERVGISVSPEYLDHGRLGIVPQMILDYPKASIRRKAKKCLRWMAQNNELMLTEFFEYGEYAT